MKSKLWIISTVAVLSVTTVFGFSALNTQASSPEQEARQVVSHYLDALIAKDAKKAASFVKDFSYKNKVDTIAGYRDVIVNNPMYSYKIISVKQTSATNASIDVEFTEKVGGTNQANLKAAKIGPKWYVLVMKSTAPVADTIMGEDGQLYLPKDGLQIMTAPPEGGVEEVAWRFFKLRGEQKYDQALDLVSGYLTTFKDEPSRSILQEVIASEFVRAADITSLAPNEEETEGAFARKVVYLELNLKLRGFVSPDQTDLRNGLNRYAVHLTQQKEGAPWKIVLLGGCPWLEK